MPKTSSARREQGEGVAAIDRAVTILVALESACEPLTLAGLAAQTGLYKSTLLRLLASLRRSVLVVRRDDQRYVLGQFALRLGKAFELTKDVEGAIVPIMRWLIQQGTESPSFHVRRDQKTRSCLFRMESNHSTVDRVRAGDFLPLNRGAPGRVLIAWAAGAQTTGESLAHVSFGERDPQCAAVSVPVFANGGELIGALSVSGPLGRFSEVAVRKMGKAMLQAGRNATVALGGTWPTNAVTDFDTGPARKAAA